MENPGSSKAEVQQYTYNVAEQLDGGNDDHTDDNYMQILYKKEIANPIPNDQEALNLSNITSRVRVSSISLKSQTMNNSKTSNLIPPKPSDVDQMHSSLTPTPSNPSFKDNISMEFKMVRPT